MCREGDLVILQSYYPHPACLLFLQSVNITSGFTNGDDRTATAASSPPPTTATSQVGDGDTASEVTAGYTVSEVSEDAGKNKLGNGELSSPE